jgi:hypothetical protein
MYELIKYMELICPDPNEMLEIKILIDYLTTLRNSLSGGEAQEGTEIM